MPGHHDQHDSANTWKGQAWFALPACSCTSCKPCLTSPVQTHARKMLISLEDLHLVYPSREKRRSKATAPQPCCSSSAASRTCRGVCQGGGGFYSSYVGFSLGQVTLNPAADEGSSALHQLRFEPYLEPVNSYNMERKGLFHNSVQSHYPEQPQQSQ